MSKYAKLQQDWSVRNGMASFWKSEKWETFGMEWGTRRPSAFHITAEVSYFNDF